MITINLICVGNLKEKFWKDACEEYSKRLSRFCKLKISELDEQKTLEKEGKDILNAIKGKSVLMDIKGKEVSSEELAKKLELWQNETSTISIIIGSSCGVSDEVKNAADEKISFGKVTYPHNLMRVILLEQIYRAFMINSGASYHK